MVVLIFKNTIYVLTEWKIYVLSFLFVLRYISRNVNTMEIILTHSIETKRKKQHGNDEGAQGTERGHKKAIFCLNFTWAFG